jgi:hypothetical protein
MRIFSGIQPTGDKHLGNLIGGTLSHEIGHSLGLANPFMEGFHNAGDAPNRIMDSGGNRPFVERAELAILDEYLPQQLDAAAIEPVVAAAIAELGATSVKDIGAVLKASMAKLGGAADGKEVSAIVKRHLEE